MKRVVEINGRKLTSPETAHTYLKGVFFFDDDYQENLKSLRTHMAHIEDDIDIQISSNDIRTICVNPYAYKILMVIGQCCDINPNLHIHFYQ